MGAEESYEGEEESPVREDPAELPHRGLGPASCELEPRCALAEVREPPAQEVHPAQAAQVAPCGESVHRDDRQEPGDAAAPLAEEVHAGDEGSEEGAADEDGQGSEGREGGHYEEADRAQVWLEP